MPLVKFVQPNLIQGVSQQPAAMRTPGQCEDMVNCYPSPVDGLVKRPPTSVVKDLGATPVAAERYHTIYRDDAEQYLIRVSASGVLGTNLLTGASITVTDPDSVGFSYLASITDPQDLELVTVGDTTFVLNKGKVPSMETATKSPAVANTAILFLRQGDYSTDYSVTMKVNNVVSSTATTSTWKGTGTAAAGEIQSVKTEDIMSDLATKIATLAIPGVTVVQQDSLIELTFASSVTSVEYIKTADSVGDSALSAVYDGVPRVEGWLPETCRDGFKILVEGDGEVDADDYWVEFKADGEEAGIIGKGKWLETVAPDTQTTLDAGQMPHILTSTGTNTFEWNRPGWGTRAAGDENTNPDPSFVGLKIKNLFFYKDRLGFLADAQVIMSEQGNYYNFFRSTILTLRDSAVIDVTSNHTKVTVFENAVPFNENMMLFSRKGQFVLRGSDILSPRTVQILPAAEFESAVTATPEPTAKSVFFPFARGQQSGLREIFQTADILTFDAVDVTAPVPNYIQGGITFVTGTTLEDFVVVLTDQQDGNLYMYKYTWSGKDKVQSAWGTWNFPGASVTVLHAGWVENSLYLVLDRNGELFLEVVVVATGVTDPGQDFTIHLDQRITEADVVSAVYSSSEDSTTFTLPFGIDDTALTWAAVDRSSGVQLNVTQQTSTTFVVSGDHTADSLFIGTLYDMVYEYTVPVVKRDTGRGAFGEYTVPQTVRAANVQYAGSRTLQAEVTVGNRAMRNYELVAIQPDTPEAAVDGVTLHSGDFRVPILGTAKDVKLVLRNGTPYPSNISATSWEINYHERARRV